MKKYFFFLLGFFVFAEVNNCAAQTDPFVDSLKKVLATIGQDTNRLKLLDLLGDNAPDGEWQKFSEEMGKLADKLSKNPNAAIAKVGKKHQAIYMNNLAFIAAEKGDYKSCLGYFDKALKIQRELGD